MASLDFMTAFRYPFRRWKGLLNILWVLVPIYGWFLLFGYRVRILTEFLDGKYKKLPPIQHAEDFVLGWKMFWKAFPGILVVIAAALVLGMLDPQGGLGTILFFIIALLVIPILAMNFIRKRTVAACFEIDLVRVVLKSFVDYVIAVLKDLALSLLFLVMWLILVGLPAGTFTKSIFLAEFYRTHVKK